VPEDTSHSDPFALERFVEAQDAAGAYQRACAELRAGRKQSHWIWYVFPQMKGLGTSHAANFYGIGSRAEARAYLAHAVLGPRLNEATACMLALSGCSLHEILGSPDDLKFRSSMTLFASVAGPGSLFGEALDKFCGGEPDPRTLALLREN
jgi:uncharacterized protein (DUF1810 family)